VPGRPFQPILMFECEAGAYLNEAPIRQGRLGWKILLGNKCCGLLRTFVNLGRKKFYNICPTSWAYQCLSLSCYLFLVPLLLLKQHLPNMKKSKKQVPQKCKTDVNSFKSNVLIRNIKTIARF
jgi:hypothetical protein